jgi:hypothetical protein
MIALNVPSTMRMVKPPINFALIVTFCPLLARVRFHSGLLPGGIVIGQRAINGERQGHFFRGGRDAGARELRRV